jgi:hypothetical protein
LSVRAPGNVAGLQRTSLTSLQGVSFWGVRRGF